MQAVWLRLSILLAASLTPCAANETNRVLNSDLKSWNRLKRDAGYFTESGQWRGGLYRGQRTTETEHHHCLNHTKTHCTSWTVSERSFKKRKTGKCECNATADAFCRQWTCNARFNHDCSIEDTRTSCVTQETLNCHCLMAAPNQRYCWKWHCQEESVEQRRDYSTEQEGRFEFEDYECLLGDITGEFCFGWHGNASSKYEVESSACQCFERGQSFCKHWMCRERGIRRCSQSGLGWCRLEVAIGFGGGIGLFAFLLAITCLSRCAFWELGVKLVLVSFVVFCLPLFVGVVIWGGVFGIPWVLLMWSVVLLSVIFATKWIEHKRNEQRVDLPRIQMAEIQLPEPTPITTKSIDDSQSDKANDVCA